MQIKDSVILITGAATRVGREVALYFAERGAHISFSYYLPDEPWQQTCEEIEAFGVKSLATQVEIRDFGQVGNLVAETEKKLGKINVLINNASIWLKTPFLEISEQDWDLSLDINLKGVFLASQAAALRMLANGGGLIINITDLSAFQVWPGYAHHAASKAGLVALTKSMAYELAPTIRVNAIAPGTVLLPPNPTPAKVEWAVEKSVLKRVGTPVNVAQVAQLFMENEFITGAIYQVDGGRSLV